MKNIASNAEIIEKLREVIDLPARPKKIVIVLDMEQPPVINCEFYPVATESEKA